MLSMSLIEKRIISTVLGAIRKRRDTASARNAQSCLPATASAKVREARFSDFKAVADLKEHWGMAADSIENWERLWRYNPALAQMGNQRPIGWVLEADDRIVGYIGNIPRLYSYGNKTLTSVTGHALVVEPAYRGIGVSLNAAYYRQKGVDLYISTGAIAPVAKIGQVFKAEGLTQSNYETAMFWVLRPYPFARAIMRKLSVGRAVSHPAQILGSLAVSVDKVLNRRCPRLSATLEVTEKLICDIGDDFEDLWIRKLSEGTLLLADRRPATLRWHFEIPGDTGTVRVLCCSKKGRLLGYMVIRDEQPDAAGLRKSLIADLLVVGDDSEVVEALFVAGYQHADKAGSHILEVLGFPRSVQQVWMRWNPYKRKYPSSPFLFKAADPLLHSKIADGMTWYACLFDGDFTLIRPSYSPSGHRSDSTEYSNRLPKIAGTRSEITQPFSSI
jgi:hypothetical protein